MKRILPTLARISFSLTIILIPFRWRIVLLERPNPPLYGDYVNFLLFAADIALVCTLILWGISCLLEGRKISLGSPLIWIPLSGLTAAGWISAAASIDPPLSVYHAIRLTFLFLFMLFIVNEIESPAWIVIPGALMVLIQSLAAIAQSILQHDLGLQAGGEYVLDPLVSGASVLESGGVRFLRAYGFSDHPNILGGCLTFGLLILFATFISGTRGKWLAALVFVPGSVALLLSFSRSAWIGLIVGCSIIIGAMVLQNHFRSALLQVIFLGSICLSAMGLFIIHDSQYLAGRLNIGGTFTENRVESGSIDERNYLLEKSNPIIIEHAVSGVGLGVAPIALKNNYPNFPMNYQPPHVGLVEAAMETGIIGASFYFLLNLLPIFTFFINHKKYIRIPHLVAIFSILMAISAVGLFDYYFWLTTYGRIIQWTAWGLWSGALMTGRNALN